MPFQSDRQRKWMYANEPGIAREWSDRYGAMNGGIINGLNRRHYLTGATGANVGMSGMTLEDMMELMEQNPGGALMNQGMASPYLGMNSPLNFPGEEFGETTPSWARTPQWKVDNYGLPAVGIDPILKRGSTSWSEYDPAFGELETEEKYDTSYPGSYKKSHNFYGDVQGGGETTIPRLTQDDFYENFRDQGTDDTEEVREQIRTGEIPQNFQTRMNNPFFEKPTFANAPTLANYFNQGLGGMEGVKDKMGQGWDKVTGLKDTIGDWATGIMDNTIVGKFAAMRDATNPRAANYNPALQGQIDFMKEMGSYGNDWDQSGLNKITGGALAGKNLQSMWGTNDLMEMYDDTIARTQKTIDNFDKKWSKLKKKNPAAYGKKKQVHINRLETKKNEKARAATRFEQERQARIAKEKAAARSFVQQNPNYGDAGKNINPGSGGGKGYDPQHDYSGTSTRDRHDRSSDLGFSDIRLKDNVELIGQSPSNINIYKFNYLNDPTVYQGVMAQDVPWASVKADKGYLMVDYNKVDVEFKKWHRK